jgi:signal transduction histidine kinase
MPRIRVSTLVAAALVFFCAAPAHAAPRRVLLLYSYEREFSHFTFAKLFRPELTRGSSDAIEFVEVTLQTVRGSRNEPDEATLLNLRQLLGDRRMDLVVPIGGPAASFAQHFKDRLFPGAPVLLAAVDQRFVEGSALGSGETAVMVHHDPPRMIESILRLLPDTKTVVVVIGASGLEQFWLSELKRSFQPFEDRLTFVWTNQLTFADLLKRCGSLPPHSAILYGLLSLDASGAPQMEEQTLDALHASANAPLFGLHTSQFGHGIIGGPLLSIEDLSRDTAAVAVRLLNGESASHIGAQTLVPGAPTFDSRELHRWGISEARLEPGSVVRFREPAPWRRYEGIVAAVAAFVGTQAALVIALVVSVRRRRAPKASPDAWDLGSAEAALARLTHRVMQAHEEERAWIASTLHDDVCQQLTGLKMRLHALGGTAGAGGNGDLRRRIEDLCDQFSDLERQILTLSDPLYSRLNTLGLVASSRAFCQRLCAQHAIALDFRSERVPGAVRGPVRLALFRVLQEAMENAVTHARTRRIVVSLMGTGAEIELEVADEGIGFDPDRAIRAVAVGLVAMRERLRPLGGTCAIESEPGAGTRVRAIVPV